MARKNKTYSKQYVDKLRAQIKTLETLIKQNDSTTKGKSSNDNNKRSTKHNYKFFTDIGLVIATIIIAIFAMRQYYSFQDFSKKDSKAYLGFIEPVIQDSTLNKLEVIIPYQNTGKTPATDVGWQWVFPAPNISTLANLISEKRSAAFAQEVIQKTVEKVRKRVMEQRRAAARMLP